MQMVLATRYVRMGGSLGALPTRVMHTRHAAILGCKEQSGTLATHAMDTMLVMILDTKEEQQEIFKTHVMEKVLVIRQVQDPLGALLHRVMVFGHAITLVGIQEQLGAS